MTRTILIARLAVWWPVAAGLLVLYVPTFFDLATGLWTKEEYIHGPVIFILSMWLIIRRWGQMRTTRHEWRGTARGWPLFFLSMMLYAVGRSQDIQIFEMASVITTLVAILIIIGGANALKAFWFPLFFMLFMIPLPGAIIDQVTMPMKLAVSYVVEFILFFIGYPIARIGVMLQIGQYKLLVADACAGLHTLLTLESLGLLYLNIVRSSSAFRNITLALLIIPISFTANVIRVTVLTLITYHFGDAAGQGFLHGFAGMVLFISALLLIIGADAILQNGAKLRHTVTLV